MSTEFYFGNMDGGDGHKTVQGQSTLGNILPQLKKKITKTKSMHSGIWQRALINSLAQLNCKGQLRR